MPIDAGTTAFEAEMPGDGWPNKQNIFDLGPGDIGYVPPKKPIAAVEPLAIDKNGKVSGIKPGYVGADGRMAMAPERFPEVGFWRLYLMTVLFGDYRKRLVPIEGHYSNINNLRHLRWIVQGGTVLVAGFVYLLTSTLRMPLQYIGSLDTNVLSSVVADGLISDAKISDDRYPNITGREFVAEVKATSGSRFVMFEYNPPIKLQNGSNNQYSYVFSVSEVPATEAVEIARSRAQYHGEMADALQRDANALQGSGSKFAQSYKFNTVIVRLNDNVEFGEAHYLNEGDKRPSRILDNVRTKTIAYDTIDANMAYQKGQADLWAGYSTQLSGVLPTDVNSFASPVLSTAELNLRTEQKLQQKSIIAVSLMSALVYFGISGAVSLGARNIASRKVLEDHVRNMAREDGRG